MKIEKFTPKTKKQHGNPRNQGVNGDLQTIRRGWHAAMCFSAGAGRQALPAAGALPLRGVKDDKNP